MGAVKAGILGASGYGGAGLIERLWRHPGVEVTAYGSRRYAGRPLDACWPHLAGLSDARFVEPDAALGACEVLFTSTPHGATAPLVAAARAAGLRVVDLSADFRLPAASYAERYRPHPHPELLDDAVYGLVEVTRDELDGAAIVASPGCNATAVGLALAPLAAAGLLGGSVVATIVTGVSGAGRNAAQGLHFGELSGNARVYKPLSEHRHVAELELLLERYGAGGTPISFTPVLVPMARGILATVQTRPERLPSERELIDLYRGFYGSAPLVHLQEELPETKALTGSDRALLALRRDERSGTVAAFCAIDNLGKGAAGQAVQGFNIAFGFDETSGLRREGLWP